MAKVIFKSIFLLFVLLLLVLMGLENPQTVTFHFQPVLRSIEAPSALMYFAFFAIGFLSAIILLAGMGGNGTAKSGSSSKSSKEK